LYFKSKERNQIHQTRFGEHAREKNSSGGIHK
jgi:hypothetical protein